MVALNYFQNIPRFETFKLFYGKFPYSATLSNAMFGTGNRLANQYVASIGVDWMAEELGITEYRVRRAINTTHVYFLHADDMEKFISASEKVVSQYYAPRNTTELNLMVSDAKAIIRDTLFWNMFRYRIVYRSLRRQRTIEVEEFYADFLSHLGDARRDRICFNFSDPIKIYMADEHDVFMAMIAHNDIILRVEKVILRNELDEPEPVEPTD